MTLDKQAVDKMSVTSQQQSPPPASTPPPEPPVEVVHEIIETGAARKRDEPPALPPRPPPRSRQPPGVDIVEECGGLPIQPCLPPRVLHRSCWLRKYVFLCTACGGLSSLLGALFLTVYFMLRSYTSSLNYFETVPTYVPAAMLIVTGMIVMCLAGRRNRFAYLIKVCGGCCLACAVLCVVVTITTTVIHMNRLQTLRQCVYTQTTQTCTCSSGMVGPTPLDHGEEGLRYAFNSTPDCDVVHGVLYSCLRAMFGLSVIGILVCLFSCMLVYQLLSHEKKKMYWEQLEMRCRYLYRQQRAPHPCSCCDECRYPEPFPWELMEDSRYWAPGRVGNFYSPNPGEEGSTRRAPSGWSWRRLPWSRGAPPATANTSNTAAIRELPVGGDQGFRNTASSPDSQYGFSSHPAPAEGSLDSNIAPYSARETRPSQTLRTSGGPFVTEGSAGYAQHYYMWGPPPPYSNPHSHCNSPARREPRGKVDTNAARLHHLHHHHHHHHCQQNNTTAELRHRQGRGRYDEFSSSSGEGVVNSTDADKGVQVENYVNTSETEMVASGNTTSETTDSSDSKDRLNNTLTTRKVKKRIDITTVKSPTNFPYSPEHQPRSQKSSPSHFIPGNNEVGNMQGLNNKQSCQMGDRCHGGSHEMEILTEEDGQFPVSLPPNMNTVRGNDGCSVTGNVSPRMRYVAHLQGQDLQGHMLCTKNEPTESEVYFADVSSCCNVSVRNDGQDSSLYDEAVDPRKQRLVMMNVPPSSGADVYPMFDKNHHPHHHHRQQDVGHPQNSPGVHRQFKQTVLPQNMMINENELHHHSDKSALGLQNMMNISNLNAELTSNSFSYQRQSSACSRMPFPIPYHQQRDSSMTEDELTESVNRKNAMHSCRDFMELETMRKPGGMNCPRPDLSKDSIQQNLVHSNSSNLSELNNIIVASSMSISTPSPGSFSKEADSCSSGYYENPNSTDIDNCSASTTAICSPSSPLSGRDFVNSSHSHTSPQRIPYDTSSSNRLHHLQQQNNNFQNGNHSISPEFTSYNGGDQHFLAPDAQYETISQQSPSMPQPYQRHVHLHSFPPSSQEDLNGNSPSNSPIKNSQVGQCGNMMMSPGRRRLHLPLHVTSSGLLTGIPNTNSNNAESLYHTATSTEDDESESQQPQSNCYSDATMDSGCHSGSEFATRQHGGSIRNSSRGVRVMGTKTENTDESEEVTVSSMRSVNV